MSLPKYCSPFPRLSLSDADKKELRRLAKDLVDDVVDEYETYLWKRHSKLNPRHWSLVREKDDVRVYLDRRCNVARTKTQELLTVGTLLGDMDDALYGVLSPTTEAMRLLAAYTKDRVNNCAVLASVKTPTPHKPFRSMTVKWVVTTLPLHLRALAKKRDMVVVDYTGTRSLSNGETIGFQLIHSIDVPQAPQLVDYARVGQSVCSIWRQKSEDRVQIYTKSFIQVTDKLLASATVRAAGDGLVAVARSMQCAQMKKLAWLMRCKTSVLGSRDKASFAGASDLHATLAHTQRGCEVCSSQVSHPANRRGAKSVCTVCNRLVCSSCRVKRELCTITPDRRLQEQRVAFCVPCHTTATRATASDVASEEATRSGDEALFASTGGLVFLSTSHHSEDDDVDSICCSLHKSLPSSSTRGTMEDEMDLSPIAWSRSASRDTTVILGD